jgi:hypothetical protein
MRVRMDGFCSTMATALPVSGVVRLPVAQIRFCAAATSIM